MRRYWWLTGLGIALLLTALSPLASPKPTGLERVAEEQGFIERALEPAFSLMPDYVFPGITDERLATVVAGLIGVLVVFALAYGLALALRCRSRQGDDA
jgi:hypothetical protein